MSRNRGGRDLIQPYGPSARKLPDKEFSILMEDAEILFLNFSGRPGMYNQEGDRNFCVLLDPEVAEDMRGEGWNVKQLKGYEGEEGDYYISVSVKYRDRFGKELRPPKIIMRSSRNPRQHLPEDMVGILDNVDIAKVDLIINGRARDEDGQRRIKGYLQTIVVTVHEDYLDLKYSDDVPTNDDSMLALPAGPDAELAGMDIVEGELVDD